MYTDLHVNTRFHAQSNDLPSKVKHTPVYILYKQNRQHTYKSLHITLLYVRLLYYYILAVYKI